MTDVIRTDIGYDDGDVATNLSAGPTLGDLVAQRYSRRETLRSGVGAMAIAVFGGSVVAACGSDKNDTPSDPAPTVTVGSSGTASSGNLVTITGTATDNGSITSSTFVQVSGPVVTLSATTGTTTSFLAPAVSSNAIVVIRFTATDNSGNTASADANVTVTPVALNFAPVAKNKNDVVTVPADYKVSVLYRTGDPLDATTPAYKNDGTDTGFATRAGDEHDALYWFGLDGAGARDDLAASRGLLMMNHADINPYYLHANGPTGSGSARPEAEAVKEMEALGLSVVETIKAADGSWSYVQASAFNRRVTAQTAVDFSGPVKGSSYLQTAFSTDGTKGRGTIGNRGNGYTAWGTGLTGEADWPGYFRRPALLDNPRRTAKEATALARFGLTQAGSTYAWESVVPADANNTAFRRFDAQATGASATADFRNEPNQFGWVVEVDPYDATKAPRKRTALGRFDHEGCWPGKFFIGVKPAFYMGDNGEREYFYKFVSGTAWASADAAATDRLAIGDKYLDSGTLYVAQFKADGTGTWLPLTFGTAPLTSANAAYPFADQVDVLTNARLAGDALAATPMDRAGWTSVNPITGEVFITLNRGELRTPATTDAANPRAYADAPNAGINNHNGHIIRLRETGDTPEATTFAWDIYLFG
ncbi:PhoX family protein, partial [Sphingomonas sp.]|uniref:PhoX family protein n=1 Tax=Sphingomonas sp. TaxID=28214 RepID=UPI002C3C1026